MEIIFLDGIDQEKLERRKQAAEKVCILLANSPKSNNYPVIFFTFEKAKVFKYLVYFFLFLFGETFIF